MTVVNALQFGQDLIDALRQQGFTIYLEEDLEWLVDLVKDSVITLEQLNISQQDLDSLLKEYNIWHAKRLLEDIKSNKTISFDFSLLVIREIITNRSVTFEDLGTTEADFNLLIQATYARRAKDQLSYLKQGELLVRQSFDNCLQLADMTLADLDIDEAEIHRLTLAAYRASAIEIITDMRAGEFEPCAKRYVDSITEYQTKGGFTFVEIGSSDEEFAELMLLAYEYEAKFWISMMRDGIGSLDISVISDITDSAKLANLTLSELGSSDEEVDRYTSEASCSIIHQLLFRMRNEHYFSQALMDNFNKRLAESDISLSSLGTTEDELASIANRPPMP